jgi:hypothetical protein
VAAEAEADPSRHVRRAKRGFLKLDLVMVATGIVAAGVLAGVVFLSPAWLIVGAIGVVVIAWAMAVPGEAEFATWLGLLPLRGDLRAGRPEALGRILADTQSPDDKVKRRGFRLLAGALPFMARAECDRLCEVLAATTRSETKGEPSLAVEALVAGLPFCSEPVRNRAMERVLEVLEEGNPWRTFSVLAPLAGDRPQVPPAFRARFNDGLMAVVDTEEYFPLMLVVVHLSIYGKDTSEDGRRRFAEGVLRALDRPDGGKYHLAFMPLRLCDALLPASSHDAVLEKVIALSRSATREVRNHCALVLPQDTWKPTEAVRARVEERVAELGRDPDKRVRKQVAQVLKYRAKARRRDARRWR